MSAGGPPPEQSPALIELTEQVRALGSRVEALAVQSAQQSGDLQTALRALALIHDDDPGARRRLRDLRAGPSYELAFTEVAPLVSVVIPTWNRVGTLLSRALASVLNQTYSNIEVVVVGDASPPDVTSAMAAIDDPRVRFHNLTIRGPYDENPRRAWLAAGTSGFNAGVSLARGSWIAPLGDDDAFVADHVERLLCHARDRRVEFVYGHIRQTMADGSITLLGEFPPRFAQIGLQAAIYHAGLRFMEMEPGHALFDLPNDWGLVSRMMRVGVRMSMVQDVTVDYFPSLNEGSPVAELASTPAADPAPAIAGEHERRIVELKDELRDERTKVDVLRARTEELQRSLRDLRRSRILRLASPLRRLRANYDEEREP